MISIILITLIVVIILLFGYKRSKNTVCIISLMSILAFNAFLLLLYIGKVSYFRTIFEIENDIFMVLYKISCTLPQLKWWLNIGVAMFYIMLLCISFVNHKLLLMTLKRKYLLIALSVIMIAGFLWLNSPVFLENIFLMKNTLSEGSHKLKLVYFMQDSIERFNYFILVYFLILPFVFKVKEYYMTRIMFKKNELKVVMFSVAFVEILFVLLTCVTPLRYFVLGTSYLFDVDNVRIVYDDFLYVYLPIIFLIVYTFLIIILVKYGIIDYMAIIKRRFMYRKTYISVNDIRHIFHSYKNCMMSIIALQDKAYENYGTEIGKQSLDKIRLNAVEFSERAGYFLDAYNKCRPNYNKINLAECIDDALGLIIPSYSLKIDKNYTSDVYMYGDKMKISEMCRNILQNSIEAIEMKDTQHGYISISTFEEEGWVCISFYDNGCGMSRSDKKNMFKISYSQKRTFKNWGIGLSHVFNIVKEHGGFVNVSSEPGVYTEFQITFPSLSKKQSI